MRPERSGRRLLPWARRSALSLPLLWLARPAQAAMLDLRWRGEVTPLELAALDAGLRQTLTTHTPWTHGPQQFEGNPLRQLLPPAALTSPRLQVIALDDYRVDIPMADVTEHGLFLAWRRNAALMPVRDRGPFWLVYPWTDRPALDRPDFHRRSVWQVRAIQLG
jgi:hypothetical protein